ncbi:hypothetical protein SVAN01_07801 [Stagonosporopsis vannaccii]|nr:hypothetical protein SVAN01_07801 [Stagonosporopsis vannaccii]
MPDLTVVPRVAIADCRQTVSSPKLLLPSTRTCHVSRPVPASSLPCPHFSAMSLCTDFCASLDTLSFSINATPSREELLSCLPPTAGAHEWFLGTWGNLQKRSGCEFCKLAVIAITRGIPQTVNEPVDPDQPINILLFPEEASFRLSFPSPLHSRLTFVGNNAGEAHAPDSARLVGREGIDIERVRGWLQTCDNSHASCSWRNNKPEPLDPAAARHDGKPMSDLKKSFNEEATSNFRVIDVVLSCIKHVPLDVQYVALSYVWGQLPMVQLRKNNFEALTSEGGLDKIREELPKTITDSIDFIHTLGIRYLWIDGLCLIQDDKVDVSLGIGMMNSIYHGSYFTIVAASGQDANAGLPGFRQGSPCPERQQFVGCVAPGIQMTIVHSIDWYLKQSVYNQRGWTLQELVLPDRTLIFINGQVYFRCHEANWSEETWADKWTHWLDADDSNISRVPDPVEGFLPSCWAYQKLCEDFSRRKLQNDEDALRALEGVTRPMAAGMETHLVEGLPGYYLDHFLLFISTTGDMRRRAQFASFSWAGWDGAKMWPRENFEWPEATADGTRTTKRRTENILKYFQHNRLVEWSSVGLGSHAEQLTEYSLDTPTLLSELVRNHSAVFPSLDEDKDPVAEATRGALSRFGGSSSHSDIPHWGSRSYEWAGEIHVNAGAGVQKAKPLPEFCMKALDLANSQAEFDRLVDRMGNVYTRLAMYNWIAVRRLRGSRRTCSMGHTNAFPPHSVLAFTTVSIHLTLGVRPPLAQPTSRSPFYRTPGIPLLGSSGATVGSLHPDDFSSLPSAGSAVEVLVVARCWKPIVGSALLGLWEAGGDERGKDAGAEGRGQGTVVAELVAVRESEEREGEEKESEETNSKSKAGFLWVLAVEWESGVARRSGAGQITEGALQEATGGVVVKSVILG